MIAYLVKKIMTSRSKKTSILVQHLSFSRCSPLLPVGFFMAFANWLINILQ